MDWLTLLATVAGGSAALLGTVIAHALSTREDRRRDNSTERRDSYVAYLVALDGAFGMVRRLADPHETIPDLPTRLSQVFGDAGVYRSRERLLLAGNPSVVSPAEATLSRLGKLRDAVRDGAKRRTLAYHDVFHRYSEALWRLRISIRKDLGSEELTPADVEKGTWDSQADCEFCRTQRAASRIPSQTVPTA